MNLKKILSAVVSVAMIIGTMGTIAMAAEGPDATVTVLPATSLAGDSYMVWPSGDDSVERPLNVVMNFQSQETPEEANKGGYADYLTDFYVTLTGLANGSIVADDCYLAGNYGEFGWIVIPMDGTVLEDGVTNPVVAVYDAEITYRQICQTVKNFTAAIHVAPAIAEANPDMKLTLELKLTNPNDANDVITVGSYTYTGAELSATVAKIGNTEYMSLEEAVAAAQNGDTIVMNKSAMVQKSLVIDKDITLDLNGNTIQSSAFVQTAPAIRVLGDVTVTNGTVDGTPGDGSYAFIVGNNDTAGTLTIADGTYKGDVSAISITKGTANISGGTFSVPDNNWGTTYLLNCIDANYRNETAKYNITGGSFVGFDPEHNAAEGAGTNFLTEAYTTKVVDGAYEVIAKPANKVIVTDAVDEDATTVSQVLFEKTGVITDAEDQTKDIPWCSYKFTVTGSFNGINVETKKDGKELKYISGPESPNYDGTVMYGVVVTGIDSIDEIVVTTN